jgi:glycosyltransferase involved in cell wall biosynthesis
MPAWPATNGFSLRVSNLLRELSADWSITLIAPSLAPSVGQLPVGLVRHIPLDLAGSGLSYPWRFDQKPLKAAVQRAVKALKPKRALVWRGAEAAWFDAPDLPPSVIDLIDCTPLDLWRSLFIRGDLRSRYRKLRELTISARFVNRTTRSFSSVVCAGEMDAVWVRRLGRGSPVHVVQNGVALPDAGSVPPQSDRPTLSFIGTLDFEPNIDAVFFLADEIWPIIKKACPSALLVVAGRNPTPRVLSLADRPGIEIHPDVMRINDVLGRSWASIAPMRSGVGVKNKVLEAWACSRPVVLTPLAVNGLMVPTGHEFLVRDSSEALAAAVVTLLQSREMAVDLGEGAFRHAAQHYGWKRFSSRIDLLLRQASHDELYVHQAPGQVS